MDRNQSKLSGFFAVINKLEDIVLAILVTGMVVTILMQIIGRMTGNPFPWTEETSRYLFLWMMFVALAAGFNRCESARVVLLVQLCPAWMKRASELLYAVFVLGFFVVMFVYGLEVVQQQIRFNEMGTALPIPMYLIGICQPVGAVLGFIGTIQSFLEYRDKVVIGDMEAEKRKALQNEG